MEFKRDASSISLAAKASSSSFIAGRSCEVLLFAREMLIVRPRATRLATAGFEGDASRTSRRRKGAMFVADNDYY